MKCNKCGNEINSDAEECSVCRSESQRVQVLTSEENRQFQGMTLEQDGRSAGEEYSDNGAGPRIYVRHVGINTLGMGFFIKLLIGLVLLGVIVFVALPVVLLFLAGGLVLWLLTRR